MMMMAMEKNKKELGEKQVWEHRKAAKQVPLTQIVWLRSCQGPR